MALSDKTMRGVLRYLPGAGGKVGAAVQRLVVWPQTTAPVYGHHIRPTSAPSGTAAKGDFYTGTDGVLYTHDGTAFRGQITGTSTAQTIGGQLTVSGALLASSTLNYKQEVIDTGGAFASPIALTEAQSARVILIDDAAGLDFTLPAVAAAQIGTWYKFLVTTTITSNSFRVTAAAGDLLRGGVAIVDFNTANTLQYFTPDESDDLIYTADGSTKGGKKGTVVTFTAIHATGWFVEGLTFGDGALATPFS